MRTDLRKAAKAALDASKDEPERAVKWLTRQPDIAPALARLGAQQVIRDFFAAQRASAMARAVGRVIATADNPDTKRSVAARMARHAFWDAYTLFGMAPIKTATRQQLLDSAEARERQGNTELRLAKFERAVAAKLTTGRATVGGSMTLGELERIASKFKAAQ